MPIERYVVLIVTTILLIAVLYDHFEPGDSDDDGTEEVAGQDPDEVIHFAVAADQHYGRSRIVPDHPFPPYDDETVDDWMWNPRLPEMDFTIASMGDWVSDRRYGQWTNLTFCWDRITENNADHQAIPYFWVMGNHDQTNYEDMIDGNPLRSEMIGRAISGLNENNYAFMYNNVLFICAAQTNSLFTLSNFQRSWMEHLVGLFPDTTTVILSHQAMMDTTGSGDDRATSWDGKDYKVYNDVDWWYPFFEDNPQIVLYIHGHTEKGFNTTVLDYHTEAWDDHCTFVLVPSNRQVTPYFSNQRAWSYVFTIREEEIAVRLWDSIENEFVNDTFVGVPYVRTGMANDLTDSGMEWFSIPKRVLDGQEWGWQNRMMAEGYLVELVGSDVTEQIDNPEFDGCFENDELGGDEAKAYWYAVRGDMNATNLGTGETDGFIEISGRNRLELAASPTDGKEWVEGKVPYNTAIAIPGKTYEFACVVRTVSGNGMLDIGITIPRHLDLGENVWDNVSVLSNMIVDSTDTLCKATFTVPDDPDVWFIQPSIDLFDNTTTYIVESWSLKLVGDGAETEDFHLRMNGWKCSKRGTIGPNEGHSFPIDAPSMDNDLEFNCSIGGNGVGMVRLVYVRPLLWSDDVSFGWRNGSSVHLEDVSPFNNRTTIMSFEDVTIGIDGFETEIVRGKYLFHNRRFAAGIEGDYDIIEIASPVVDIDPV